MEEYYFIAIRGLDTGALISRRHAIDANKKSQTYNTNVIRYIFARVVIDPVTVEILPPSLIE